MDKSARGLNFSSMSPFSSKSPRTPITNPRRSLAGLQSSANRNSSRYSISGRSTQSVQIIYKTPYHVVESYGTALPVMVTEALAFADRSSTVSVRLSATGWAWFVCGRRLLVWQYRQEGQGRWAPGSQCRELTLPPSDLAHRAQLVAVFLPERAHVPSCIAVSPEGAVRYWSSIAHEGSWIEESADLQGQECDSLSDMTSVGCVLATTTSTICLVAPKTSGGRHSILCHTLRSPQSWLGGIGRRVSSIIFGSMPSAQTLETRLVKVVPLGGVAGADCRLLVLAGHSLQKWVLNTREPERMVFEFDMDRLVRDNFLNAVWDVNLNAAQELTIWLLDMQPVEGGVMLLTAAANTHISSQIHYAAALVMTDSDTPPDNFHLFCILKLPGFYQGEDVECEGLTYQFLLYGSTALVYNRKHLLAVTVSPSQDEPDRIEFVTSGDCLLGASLCGTTPLFFSRSHGLVSITSADSSPLDLMNASLSYSEAPSVDHLSMSHLSETANLSLTGVNLEDLAAKEDNVCRLKAAFVYFNRRELSACQDILMDVFPPQFELKLDVDAPLDLVVIQVSKDIINDMPAADPRWAETHCIGPGLSTSASLQILQQLQGKQQTLELYVHFLKAVNLWQRLSAVTVRGVVIATAQAIQEHSEKLTAAVALRNLHDKYADLLDRVMKDALYARKVKISGGLTHLDLIFREVTRIHEVLQRVASWCDDVVHSNKTPLEVVSLLQKADNITLETLQEVVTFRKQRAEMFAADQVQSSDLVEYLPWTSAPGDGGLRDTLLKQLDLSLCHGAKQAVGDLLARSTMCDSLLGLADLLLDGYRSHLESLRGGEKHDLLVQQYELQRRNIIKPFLDEGMTEAATKLAEKYLDFQTLVQLCETTKNQERLDQYIQKFAEHGFSEFVFGWYMREGQQDKLLRLFGGNGRPMQHQQALVGFLSQHPQLAWLQALRANHYAAASNTLRQLAAEQTELLARKKTILSLAKLCALASDELPASVQGAVENIEYALGLVGLQEELPQSVLNYLGQDADNMSVFTPSQLVDLYISSENENANMFDFKKALHLLDYIDDDLTRDELKQRIWCQAVLRDSWEGLDMTYPMEACRQLLVFKLMDLVVTSECSELIMPLDALLECSELGPIINSQSFKYLTQFFYEQLASTMDCSSQ